MASSRSSAHARRVARRGIGIMAAKLSMAWHRHVARIMAAARRDA